MVIFFFFFFFFPPYQVITDAYANSTQATSTQHMLANVSLSNRSDVGDYVGLHEQSFAGQVFPWARLSVNYIHSNLSEFMNRVANLNPVYGNKVAGYMPLNFKLKRMKLVCLKGRGDWDGTSSNGSLRYQLFGMFPLFFLVIFSTSLFVRHRRARRLSSKVVRLLVRHRHHTYRGVWGDKVQHTRTNSINNLDLSHRLDRYNRRIAWYTSSSRGYALPCSSFQVINAAHSTSKVKSLMVPFTRHKTLDWTSKTKSTVVVISVVSSKLASVKRVMLGLSYRDVPIWSCWSFGSKIIFSLVPIQLWAMVAALLRPDHITYRFEKGTMPKIPLLWIHPWASKLLIERSIIMLSGFLIFLRRHGGWMGVRLFKTPWQSFPRPLTITRSHSTILLFFRNFRPLIYFFNVLLISLMIQSAP